MKLTNFKNKKTYEIKKEIYENAQNFVWCGIATESEFGECFIKIITYNNAEDKEQRIAIKNSAKSEVKSIEEVSRCSKKVPRLFDCWDDSKNGRFIIVMEKMQGQTLREWMTKRPLTNPTEKDLFVRSQIIKQIAQIMSDIHKNIPSIVHRDLKPENIFINLEDKKWVVSIIDFGCAGYNFIRNVGTEFYQAPEQVYTDTPVGITYKTDVFAIGQIFYEILSGKAPRLGVDIVRQRNAFEWRVTPSLPENITQFERGKKLEKLIKSMTEFDLEKRPDYNSVIKHLNFKLEKNNGRKQWKK